MDQTSSMQILEGDGGGRDHQHMDALVQSNIPIRKDTPVFVILNYKYINKRT